MTYAKKLTIAKIFVSVGLIMYGLLPFIELFDPNSEGYAYNTEVQLYWLLIGNLIALPIMLWAIWSKLHGTGRSVRLVAFLGMAYTLGFYVAGTLFRPSPPLVSSDSVLYTGLGEIEHTVLAGGIFIILLVGVIMSIRPKGS